MSGHRAKFSERRANQKALDATRAKAAKQAPALEPKPREAPAPKPGKKRK
jgi:hypothetical protein